MGREEPAELQQADGGGNGNIREALLIENWIFMGLGREGLAGDNVWSFQSFPLRGSTGGAK